MKWRYSVAASLAVLVAAGSGHAATSSPGDASSLAPYIGHWACEGHFTSNNKPIASTISFSSALAGKGLVKAQDDVPTLGNYHSVETWAFDAKASQWVAGIVDSFGGVRTFRSPGQVEGKLTWTLVDGQPAQQFVYSPVTAGKFQLDWLIERPGKGLVVGDTLTCRRLASTS
jgi:hypothetical protein